MWPLTLQSLIILTLSSVALSQFTYPAAGDKVSLGETVDITWTVDQTIDKVGLSICKSTGDPTNPDCSSIAGGLDNSGEYSWKPSSSLDAGDGYYLIMTAGTGFVATSGNFELENGGSSSSSASLTPTSGSSITTGSGAVTATAPATVTQTVVDSPANSSTPNGTGSSGNGAIIGGAVAAAVVVIVLILGAFIFMRKRNQKKVAAAAGKRRPNDDDDDVEATGNRSGRSSMLGGKGERSTGLYDPKEGFVEAGSIPLAELPATQQEPVEMAAAPGQHFFAMELDSREIPRPGVSTIHPDAEGFVKKEEQEPERRNVSIDGTTVDGDGDRPKTAGTIEQIKEESREGSSRNTQPVARSETPVQETGPQDPRVRDSTPQIRNSFPRLPAFDFDSSKF